MLREPQRVAIRFDREVLRVTARGQGEHQQEAAHRATLYQRSVRSGLEERRVGQPGRTLRAMTITLFHHPFSRAAGVVWTLEEIGEPYELRFVDILKGAQKTGEGAALNPMGKVPVLVDGDTVVTESAAIALYMADCYASGRLATTLHDQR